MQNPCSIVLVENICFTGVGQAQGELVTCVSIEHHIFVAQGPVDCILQRENEFQTVFFT